MRTSNHSSRSRFAPAQPLAAVVLTLLGAGLVGSCNLDEIITVEPPDRVTEELLNDPAQAALMVAGVQATFECSYGGYIVGMGLFSGELNSLGNTNFYSYDRRDPRKEGGFAGIYATSDCNNVGIYPGMSSARWFAEQAAGRLEGWTDAQVTGRMGLIATAYAYAGYAYLHLAEGFCSMAIDQGPELTSAQVFALAEDRFTKALAAAQTAGGTVGTDIGNMARVGRARARLSLAKNAEAVTDAQGVTLNYVKNATTAAGHTLRENQIFVWVNRSNGNTGLGPNYWNVTWQGVPDPRVPAQDRGNNTLGVRHVAQLLHTSEASPIPLATWDEAQLIIAEIQGGQAAVDIINALHTKYNIPSFGGGDAATILAQIIEERRRQLFLRGQRAYDIRRRNLPLDPPAGSPFRWGGLHGDARCLPLPDIERDSNPNI
jgi:hypothetical protein